MSGEARRLTVEDFFHCNRLTKIVKPKACIVLCPGASQGPAGYYLLRFQASKSLLSPPQEQLLVLLVDSIIVLSYDKQKIKENYK